MANLEAMNLKDLRALASTLDIPNRSKLRKAELVLALLAAQRPQRRDAAPAPVRHEAPESVQGQGSSASSMPAQAPAAAHGPHGDPGLPLPDSYGRDCVVLMVQDPQHIYAWWELTGPALAQARAEAGPDAAMVLLLRGSHGEEQREVDFAAGNYYFSVAPESTYAVALALRDASGRLIILAQSAAVQTPPMGVSDCVDEEWMAVDETFSELVRRAQIGDGSLSSAERLRAMGERTWSQTPVAPWFSGHLMAPPSSLALSSTALSSAHLSRR